MSWKEIDERLIRRGELVLDTGFIEGYEAWAKLKDCGRRWMAETAFSTFKRLFGSTA